jgi:hypothetical protein
MQVDNIGYKISFDSYMVWHHSGKTIFVQVRKFHIHLLFTNQHWLDSHILQLIFTLKFKVN